MPDRVRRRRLTPGRILGAQARGDYDRCPRCTGWLAGTPARSLAVTSRVVVVCGRCAAAERAGALVPVTAWPVPRPMRPGLCARCLRAEAGRRTP